MCAAPLPTVRRVSLLYVVLLAAVLSGAAAIATPNETPGVIVDPIACSGDATQSYALYLPSAYSADRAWPIVYCFDPAARGRRAVERFQEAAERFGYIVIGSNNSRNNQPGSLVGTVNSLLSDTRRRFRIDPRRQYAAGFSGGARVASLVGCQLKFAGIIACGAGFMGDVPEKVGPAFFGCAGREDYNYFELRDVDDALAERNAQHRFVTFEGEHQWLPESVAVEALAWMELQAMRKSLRERDEALVARLFNQRLAAAAALNVPGEHYVEHLAIVEDFRGLADTREIAAKAAALRPTKDVRRHLKEDKDARAQYERWNEELRSAIAAAQGRGPSQAAVARFMERSHTGTMTSADMEMTVGAGNDDETFGDADPYAALSLVVRGVAREAEHSVAARLALNGAYALLMENGFHLTEARKYTAAIRCFEAASLVHPSRPAAYARMASAYVALGDKSKARKALESALAHGFTDAAQIQRLRDLTAP